MTINEGTVVKGGVNSGQPKSKRPAAPSRQNPEPQDYDRWMCGEHGALKIEQTYIPWSGSTRGKRKCGSCQEPVSYMSQAEAAELPSKDSKTGVTLEQRAENVHRAVRLMKELRPVIIELEEEFARAEEVFRHLGDVASTIPADDTDDEPAWKPIEDEAPVLCPKCNYSPFHYRLDGAQITYGCKCGHEWEAGS